VAGKVHDRDPMMIEIIENLHKIGRW